MKITWMFFDHSFPLFLKRSFFILLLFFSYNSIALNYYWIGNGGNWSSLSHWATTSGGTTLHIQLPTANDDVFFDVNSFSLTGQTVTVNQPSVFAHHINWTGVLNNPTWGGISPNVVKIYGSLALISDMTMNFSGQVQFLSTATGQTIATTGKVLPGVTFNGIGGEWTLQDALSCTGISLYSGTLNTNDKMVTAIGFGTATNSAKALNMGSSVFNLSGNFPWGVSGTGFTVSCGTSVINCTTTSTNAQFSGGGTLYDVNFTGTTGAVTVYGNFHDVNFAGNATINGPANFHDVTFQGDGTVGPYSTDTYRCKFNNLNFTAGHTYRLGVLTINGNLNANGSCLKLISIRPVGNSNTSYITFANPVHLSYVDMRSTLPIGIGPFTVSHSLPFCCNGGWTYLNTPANMYWIGNGGNWNDPNHWSYTSGGPSAGCFPFQDKNVFFDANSFSIPGQSVTIDSNAYCMDMDWTGVTNTPTLVIPVQKVIYIFGSLIFNPAMGINQLGGLTLDAKTAGKTITTHGHVLGQVRFGSWHAGEWTLQDSFSSNSAITYTKGTLNTNNQTVNALTFTIFGGTLNMGSSVFNISGKWEAWRIYTDPLVHINCGTSVINFSNDTASLGNSSLSSNMGYTLYDVNFNGTGAGYIFGPLNFHNVVFKGKGVIWQNYVPQVCTYNDVIFHKDGEFQGLYTFHNLDFTAGHSYKFQSGRTQTITNRWKVQGTCSENITLETDVAGTFASINKAADSVHGNYLNIRDIHTIGGAAFIAYNSIDQGGNTGWNFTSPLPVLGNPGPVSGLSTVCQGTSGIIFHLSPVPGAFSYQWTVPAGASIVSGQGDTVIVVDFGTSSSGNIQVQSFDGCNLSTIASNLAITVLPQLTPAVSLAADPGTFVCPATLVSFTASASGTGSSVVNYEFKVNGTTVQSGNAPVFTSGIMNGDRVSCIISVSSGSCNTSTTAISNEIIMNTSSGAQLVHVNAGTDVIINPGQTVQLNASTDNGIYLWSPGTGLSSINILNPQASPLVTTQYTLMVTTASGCSASDNIIVEVKAPVPNCEIEPRNAFSPNGDGINDRWIVFSGSCDNYPGVSVYNRYGSLVYQSQYYQNDWQGTYKGKQLPDGTYYAVVTSTINGRTIVKKTAVSILR